MKTNTTAPDYKGFRFPSEIISHAVWLSFERSVMGVSWGEQKEEGQARAATEQGMHARAAQERARMLGWGMAQGGIRVGASPSEDGHTIDDQIARADEPTTQGGEHAQDKEGFGHRRAGLLPALPLLRGARNAGAAILAQGQAARQG